MELERISTIAKKKNEYLLKRNVVVYLTHIDF